LSWYRYAPVKAAQTRFSGESDAIIQ